MNFCRCGAPKVHDSLFGKRDICFKCLLLLEKGIPLTKGEKKFLTTTSLLGIAFLVMYLTIVWFAYQVMERFKVRETRERSQVVELWKDCKPQNGCEEA